MLLKVSSITPEKTKYRLVTSGNFEIGGGFKSAKFKSLF